MNGFAHFLQQRISVVAILAVSVLGGLFWLVGDGVTRYASLYVGQSAVLGEQSSAQFRCIPQEQVTTYLADSNRSITIFSPDTSVNFPLAALTQCFAATGCEASGFSCGDGVVGLLSQCVTDYFKKNPLGVETTKVVSGAGAFVQVRTHDWAVNYENLAQQLNDAVAKEVTYCQLVGEGGNGRQNIGSIQLVVADEQPGVADASFAEVFLEVDESKEKAYLWNKGVYQVFTMQRGVRIPAEAVYLRKDVDMSKLLGSADTEYVLKHTTETTFVVVHQ